MNEFNTLVEKYLQFDKRTLAELLAIKELRETPLNEPIQPLINPQAPNFDYPFITPTWPQRDKGDWVVTCMTK